MSLQRRITARLQTDGPLTGREIADRLGMPIESVRVALSLGKKIGHFNRLETADGPGRWGGDPWLIAPVIIAIW